MIYYLHKLKKLTIISIICLFSLQCEKGWLRDDFAPLEHEHDTTEGVCINAKTGGFTVNNNWISNNSYYCYSSWSLHDCFLQEGSTNENASDANSSTTYQWLNDISCEEFCAMEQSTIDSSSCTISDYTP